METSVPVKKVTNMEIRKNEDPYLKPMVKRHPKEHSSHNLKKCINKEERIRHLPGYCP